MPTKDVALVRDPATGLWDLQRATGGNPASDTSQTHAVMTQLMERRGSPGNPGWIWDSLSGSGTPNTHGSLLYLITADTPEARAQFKAYALDAVQPLVNESRITDVSADVAMSSTVRGRVDGVVSWRVPGENVLQTVITPLVFP